MKYITRLESDNSQLRESISAVDDQIVDFLKYLESSKFYNNPTIQSVEVYRKLQEIRNTLWN